jgi:hypothetical protein
MPNGRPNIVVIWGDDIDRVAPSYLVLAGTFLVTQFLDTFREFPSRQ